MHKMNKEAQNIEWKESWRDEYLKWICGFANAQGGTIYIGIRDDGSVCGVANIKKLMEDIPNKIRDVLGIVADINLVQKEKKNCLEIVVEPNSYPVSYKGEYHYRSGSTKQQLQGQALNQFLLKKMGLSWDGVPVDGVAVKDLHAESFAVFREQAVRSNRMNARDVKVSKKSLLDKLRLLENKKLTRAAILLFHHDPERWIPGAYVKIGFFETDANLLYQDEVHGSLFEQAEKVVDLIFTKYLIASISYRGGLVREETYPYPKEAVREAVYNALIHKDYAPLIPIQISVYKDRLYIANDCVFPEGWTAKNLLAKHRSRAHNPLIADTFFRAGYVEVWGRGIEKIRDACELENCAMPEFDISSSEITVLFKAMPILEKGTGVRNNSPQKGIQKGIQKNARNILEYISENPFITIAQLSDAIGITRIAVRKNIARLKAAGRIRRIGPDKGGHWEVVE